MQCHRMQDSISVRQTAKEQDACINRVDQRPWSQVSRWYIWLHSLDRNEMNNDDISCLVFTMIFSIDLKTTTKRRHSISMPRSQLSVDSFDGCCGPEDQATGFTPMPFVTR